MSEVNINYKGSTIASMDASGTKTLQTSGKYCEDDVEVVYTRPTPPVPSYQTKSVTPSESAQTVTADSGYDALEEVDVGAISSTYVGSGITRRSSSSLTASGATVTAPAGYYESQATKSVASGTAGTPTATKGTVSNHSVSVTPSVTNTTGYITGSTKVGTAVTVSASELVSGNKAITANGTNIDVANYSTVSVAVPAADTKTAQRSSSTQLKFTGLLGEPKYFEAVLDTTFTHNYSTSKQYVVSVHYSGSSTTGLRISRTSSSATLTSNTYYSFTYSSGVLDITSSSTSAGGEFISGATYHLIYAY